MPRKRKRDKRGSFANGINIEAQDEIQLEIKKDIRTRAESKLNDEQKLVPELLDKYDLVIAEGKWASGKTYASLHAAYHAFKRGDFKRIIITRPFIPDKGLGALPGELAEKICFEMQPILENLYSIAGGKHNVDKMLKDGELVIQYSGKVKGLTFVDAIIIVDECQDCDYMQFCEILTRLGVTSKMLITLSKEQVHRAIGDSTCYNKLVYLKESGLVGWVELKSNHRNKLINDVIDYIENAEKENK